MGPRVRSCGVEFEKLGFELCVWVEDVHEK